MKQKPTGSRSHSPARSGSPRNPLAAVLCLATALLLSISLCAKLHASTNLTAWTPMFKGIDYATGSNIPDGTTFPNLQAVYVMRVDLQDPDIQLLTSPKISNYASGIRETAGYTVSDFLVTNKVQVAINANFFDASQYYLPAGTPMNIDGLQISKGVVVSSQNTSENAATLTFTSNNVANIIYTNWPPTSTAGIYTAVSGMYDIVIKGVNVGYKYQNSSAQVHQVNPRTAMGLSQNRRFLYIMAIDGRQPGYSTGALDYETAGWMMLVGAYDAVNMDGGGSTTLVMQDSTGKPVMLNSSSAVADSGKQRTVGSHLGIYAKPVPAFINNVTVDPEDNFAVVQWATTSPSTSQVTYGIDDSLGSSTDVNPTLSTNHSVTLSGLTPATTYYFQVTSGADGTDHTSPLMVFTTTNYVTTVPIFDVEQSWKYTTANLNGVNWTAASYNDSGWTGSGPGLLWVDLRATGPNPDVAPKGTALPWDSSTGYPYVTYYFRTHFTYTGATSGASLSLTNYLDDGAVFYLNGKEIQRINMDAAPTQILNNTLASTYSCGGDAVCPIVFTVRGSELSSLVSGDNVLAVEVHNYNARSPDATFGAALSIDEPTVIAPTLAMTIDQGRFTLTWGRSGFTLQSAASPAGPWSDVSGPVTTSPYTASTTGTAQYFRLRK